MLTFLLHSPLSLLVCIHLVLVRPLALLLQVLKRQLVINILDTLEVCDEFRLPKDVVQKCETCIFLCAALCESSRPAQRTLLPNNL